MIEENINNVAFSFNASGLVANFKQNGMNVAYTNGTVSAISVNYGDYAITLNNLQTTANISAPANAITYAKLYSIYENIISYINNKQFAFNVSAVYDNETYFANIMLDLNDKLKLYAQTEYAGIDIELTVIGENIYVKASKNGKSYAFKVAFADIESVLDIVSTYVEIDKESILNSI